MHGHMYGEVETIDRQVSLVPRAICTNLISRHLGMWLRLFPVFNIDLTVVV